MESYMCGDIWTFLQDIGHRVFRFWVYRRLFTPAEQANKYIDESFYEDAHAQFGIIRECVVLPDNDVLIGFQIRSDDDGSQYDESEDKYIEYYKLSEIRLAYMEPSREDEEWDETEEPPEV